MSIRRQTFSAVKMLVALIMESVAAELKQNVYSVLAHVYILAY